MLEMSYMLVWDPLPGDNSLQPFHLNVFRCDRRQVPIVGGAKIMHSHITHTSFRLQHWSRLQERLTPSAVSHSVSAFHPYNTRQHNKDCCRYLTGTKLEAVSVAYSLGS